MAACNVSFLYNFCPICFLLLCLVGMVFLIAVLEKSGLVALLFVGSNAIPLLQFFICVSVCAFICDVCFIIICSSLLHLMPRESCAS